MQLRCMKVKVLEQVAMAEMVVVKGGARSERVFQWENGGGMRGKQPQKKLSAVIFSQN